MTTIVNTSGIKPKGQAILCVPYMPEVENSLLQLPEHVMALELMREMRGTVIALGEFAYKRLIGNGYCDIPPRCKPGDNVLISKFCGVILKGPLDGKIYRMINDEDVFGELEGDVSKMFIKDPVAESKRQGGEAQSKARILAARS